jgi:hypothetical protein
VIYVLEVLTATELNKGFSSRQPDSRVSGFIKSNVSETNSMSIIRNVGFYCPIYAMAQGTVTDITVSVNKTGSVISRRVYET